MFIVTSIIGKVVKRYGFVRSLDAQIFDERLRADGIKTQLSYEREIDLNKPLITRKAG